MYFDWCRLRRRRDFSLDSLTLRQLLALEVTRHTVSTSCLRIETELNSPERPEGNHWEDIRLRFSSILRIQRPAAAAARCLSVCPLTMWPKAKIWRSVSSKI